MIPETPNLCARQSTVLTHCGLPTHQAHIQFASLKTVVIDMCVYLHIFGKRKRKRKQKILRETESHSCIPVSTELVFFFFLHN